MQHDDPRSDRNVEPPTIDMTLDGRVLDPPSQWTKWLTVWHALPRGLVPAFLLGLSVVLIGAFLLLGVLVLIVPVALVAGFVAMLLGGPKPGARGGGLPRR